MTRHRLHSRVRHLERKAKRRPLGKRWSWLAARYAAEPEVEIYNEAHATFDRLRSALDAIRARFDRWRERNPTKPGMPLRKSEREVVGEALKCADYLAAFNERFPHRDDGVACRVVHGDADLLAKRPPDVSLVVWQVVEPVLSPEDAAHVAEIEAAVAERRRREAEGEPPDLEPEFPEVTDEPASRDARGPVEITSEASHSSERWRRELREAVRQKRVTCRVMPLFNNPTRRR